MSAICYNLDISETLLKPYKNKNGKSPYLDWLNKLDMSNQAVIRARLTRIRNGNFGDCECVSKGIYEFKIHYGPGFRIYFAQLNNEIVLLLCGGIKKNQSKDIIKANQYWNDFKEEDNEK